MTGAFVIGSSLWNLDGIKKSRPGFSLLGIILSLLLPPEGDELIGLGLPLRASAVLAGDLGDLVDEGLGDRRLGGHFDQVAEPGEFPVGIVWRGGHEGLLELIDD